MNLDQKKNEQSDLLEKFDEESGIKKNLQGWNLKLAATVAITWSLFQLWYASPLPFILDLEIASSTIYTLNLIIFFVNPKFLLPEHVRKSYTL